MERMESRRGHLTLEELIKRGRRLKEAMSLETSNNSTFETKRVLELFVYIGELRSMELQESAKYYCLLKSGIQSKATVGEKTQTIVFNFGGITFDFFHSQAILITPSTTAQLATSEIVIELRKISQSKKTEEIVGVCRIPTLSFHIALKNEDSLGYYLRDSNPIISYNDWCKVLSLKKLAEVARMRVIIAMGTPPQILHLCTLLRAALTTQRLFRRKLRTRKRAPYIPHRHVHHELDAIRVTIECAAHIATQNALNDNSRKHAGVPKCYVTYYWNASSGLSQKEHEESTAAVPHSGCPIWNHSKIHLIPSASFMSQRNIIFSVWNQRSNHQEVDELIGCAVVDVTSLKSGMKQIYGWYHIVDHLKNIHGQLKVQISLIDNTTNYPQHIQSNTMQEHQSDTLNGVDTEYSDEEAANLSYLGELSSLKEEILSSSFVEPAADASAIARSYSSSSTTPSSQPVETLPQISASESKDLSPTLKEEFHWKDSELDNELEQETDTELKGHLRNTLRDLSNLLGSLTHQQSNAAPTTDTPGHDIDIHTEHDSDNVAEKDVQHKELDVSGDEQWNTANLQSVDKKWNHVKLQSEDEQWNTTKLHSEDEHSEGDGDSDGDAGHVKQIIEQHDNYNDSSEGEESPPSPWKSSFTLRDTQSSAVSNSRVEVTPATEIKILSRNWMGKFSEKETQRIISIMKESITAPVRHSS